MKIKVRLKVDLTQYHSGLIPGLEGYTIGQSGEWSRNFDRFVGVCFPGVHTLDVLWESLEIIDEDYLQLSAKKKEKKLELLRSARNVVKCLGPRGGFRSLSFEYNEETGNVVYESVAWKQEAEELEKHFKECGISIEINK